MGSLTLSLRIRRSQVRVLPSFTVLPVTSTSRTSTFRISFSFSFSGLATARTMELESVTNLLLQCRRAGPGTLQRQPHVLGGIYETEDEPDGQRSPAPWCRRPLQAITGAGAR